MYFVRTKLLRSSFWQCLSPLFASKPVNNLKLQSPMYTNTIVITSFSSSIFFYVTNFTVLYANMHNASSLQSR
jgi:hypothetical protein